MYVVSLFSHCIPDQAEVLLNLKHKSGGTCVRVHRAICTTINIMVMTYTAINMLILLICKQLRNRGRFSGQNSKNL